MGNGLKGVLVDPRLQHLPKQQFTTFYMLLKKCFLGKKYHSTLYKKGF